MIQKAKDFFKELSRRRGEVRTELYDAKARRKQAHRKLNELNLKVAQLLEEEERLNKTLGGASNEHGEQQNDSQ